MFTAYQGNPYARTGIVLRVYHEARSEMAAETTHTLPDDVEPTANETLDRTLTGLVTALPVLGLGLVGWQLWGSALGWSDVIVFLIMYVVTGLGITVGFHRLLTHRSFEAPTGVRATLAILGSMSVQGAVIHWVADHRKHHAFSDRMGDPHSPHVDHAGLRGLFHAHVGWLFRHDQRALKSRYAPDLLKDPVVSWVNRTFFLWGAVGFVVPFCIGFILGGTLWAGLTSLLWGGLIRMGVLHHVTYSINSLCHVFGRRDFETGDESRNLAWLALPSFGESWHNNHHAFPTSSVHGLKWWQVDLSSMVIRALEKLGLAWDVVRVAPDGARI
jgi:stearoyl-CoA desaturase (delta-9 desaturase)